MKILILLLALFITGCSKTDTKEVPKPDVENKEQEDKYEDDNKIKLGLFPANGSYNGKQLIEGDYEAPFVNGQDIGSFEVFLTGEKEVYGTKFKDTWSKYYNEYENISGYKVGYNVIINLKDGTTTGGNFTEPDIFRYGNYLYVYLYDDINVPDNTFYSHLEEVNDNTIITSIKLYSVDGIDKVDSINLTAFTYDGEEDFDKDGNYRGNSKYTITIKRK